MIGVIDKSGPGRDTGLNSSNKPIKERFKSGKQWKTAKSHSYPSNKESLDYDLLVIGHSFLLLTDLISLWLPFYLYQLFFFAAFAQFSFHNIQVVLQTRI